MAIEFAELIRSLPSSSVLPNMNINNFIEVLQRRADQQQNYLRMVESSQYSPPNFSNVSCI